MCSIQILPKDLVNQIAAGEVIERPASVVKELMENALDAGAQSISVEVEDSGIGLIRIVDNGCGMDKSELELAIVRHATSKIHTISDLFSIQTLGFRGEALPSILSVSRASISTRSASSPRGHFIDIEAGEVTGSGIKGMNQGTTIEIRDLFFNTPARKKFLKTAATEQRNIIDIVSRYALAHPDKKFTLIIDGRTVLNLAGGSDIGDRIGHILGKAVKGGLTTLSKQTPEVSIYGMCASPEVTRPGRSDIYIFVNNRAVKDNTLSSAFIRGYHGMLMKGRFPVGVLFIEIEPELVDVNVHPAKNEVRFKNTQAVFGLVAGTVKTAISPCPDPTYPIADKSIAGTPIKDGTTPAYVYKPKAEAVPVPSQDSLFSFKAERLHYTQMKVIGVFQSTYILLEDPSGLYILDQHAAHERVNFERLSKTNEQAGSKQQMLLTPLVMELNAREFQAYMDIKEHIGSLGIDIDIFGENTVAIRSMPQILSTGDIGRIVRDLIHGVCEGTIAKTNYMDDIMATIACHKSITSGDNLTAIEIEGLLTDLDETGSPLTCPHGRPLFKRIAKEEIERWIGRRP